MAEQQSGSDEARKTRVFVSYSRRDKAFTDRLASELIGRGYKVDYDTSSFDPDNVDTGISAEDDWWRRLQEMIAACEAMVFVVSPESAASRVCDEEIAYARTLGKRVIAILLRSVDFTKAPPRLAALNVKLSFEHESAFSASLAALTNALDVDVVWHREGARLTALAAKWDLAGRPDSLLLPAGAVIDCEAWAARRPVKAEPPGEMLGAYLAASSAKAKADRERLLSNTGRAFVRPAEQALAEGRYDAALRLAAAGIVLSEDEAMRLVPQRASAALTAAGRSRLRAMVLFPESVEGAVFSPDGRRIVAFSTSSSWAFVRDARTGEEVATLKGHEGRITSASFSPDGRRIVTSALDKTARIWDAASGRQLHVLNDEHFIGPLSAAFSNDGRFVATGGAQHSRLWNADTGKVLASWRSSDGPKPVGLRFGRPCLALSPDMNYVVVGESAGAQLREAVSGKVVAALHARVDQFGAAAFSADGSRIALFTEYFVSVCGLDGKAIASSGKDRIADIALSPDGRRLVVLAQKRDYDQVVPGPDGRPALEPAEEGVFAPYLWDILADTRIDLAAGGNDVTQAVFSGDGNRVLTVAKNTAWLWDARTGREITALHGHERRIVDAAFNRDGTRILTASLDGTVRVWDSAGDNLIAELARPDGAGAELAPAGLSSDGAYACTVAVDGRNGLIWDTASGRSSALPGRPITFSSDGARLAVHEGDRAFVCDSANGAVKSTLAGEISWQDGLCFSPDGARVSTCRGVWDASSGRQLASFPGTGPAAFSPDGRRVVTGGAQARVWDAKSGKEVFALRCEHTQVEDDSDVETVAFSPDGARILASTPRSARLYDGANGAEVALLYLRTEDWGGHVVRAFFSRDGTKAVVLFQSGAGACVCDAVTGRQIASFTSVDHNGHIDHAPFQDHTSSVSPDGALLLAQRRDGAAHLIDIASGAILATWKDINPGGVAFSADGRRAAMLNRRLTRVLDITHVVAGAGDVGEAVAAGLAHGCGVRTWAERDELLMQSAPDDLHQALMARLTPEQRENVAGRIEMLSRPLHPNCYLAPSQRPGEHSAAGNNDTPITAPAGASPVSAPQDAVSEPLQPTATISAVRTSSKAKQAPRKSAKRRGLGFWVALAMLALGVAAVIALDRLGVISLASVLQWRE